MNLSKEQWEEARVQMQTMDSDTLLSQARMMANMDKNTIRSINPQFAGMSDAQIDGYLRQMEMMAQNPDMMRMAQQQMQTMSHEQVAAQVAKAARPFASGDRVTIDGLAKAAEHNGKTGTVVGVQGERFKVQLDVDNKTLALKPANLTKLAPASPLGTTEDIKRASEAMKQDPETLKEQARQMRMMDPDMIRRGNPAMANFSDDQIRAAADQLETMANNPAMLEMASKQMENMTPEQLRAMQNMAANKGAGGVPTPAAAAAVGPQQPPDMAQAAKMMENMDSSQMDAMIDMVKQNPQMIKDMMKNSPMMAGMDPAVVDKQLEMLDKVPPEQLKRMLGWAAKANKVFAPVASVYTKVDRLFGGRLKSILATVAVALVVAMIARFFGFLRRASGSPVDDDEEQQQQEAVEKILEKTAQAYVSSALGEEDDEFSGV